MNYENFEMNYEKLIFQSGFASSDNHRYTTTKDIHSEVESFVAISRFTLPRVFLDGWENIETTLKTLNEYYCSKNFSLDEVYVYNIKDKEFFDIVELTHNFLIPLSIKYLISPDVSDECFEQTIVPAFIAAEAKIVFLSEKILQGKTVQIDAMSYRFMDFPQSNNNRQNLNNDSIRTGSPKPIGEKLKRQQEIAMSRRMPRSPREITLNKIEE